MSGMLNRRVWPDENMSDAFIVDQVGNTLVNKANGRVLSRQPDGTWQDREPGTNGPWEQFNQNGALAVYKSGDKAEGFLFWSNVPNV